MPSAKASTWPRIAVNGVRNSCETRIRKRRSVSRASVSLTVMSENARLTIPISSTRVVSSGTSSSPRATARAAAASRRNGRTRRRPSTSARIIATAVPTANAGISARRSVPAGEETWTAGRATTNRPELAPRKSLCSVGNKPRATTTSPLSVAGTYAAGITTA